MKLTPITDVTLQRKNAFIVITTDNELQEYKIFDNMEAAITYKEFAENYHSRVQIEVAPI